MKILITLLLLFIAINVQAADSNITVAWATGGWTVTVKLTNPAQTTTTPLILAATATVDIDGVAQTPADSSVDLTMYSTIMTKKWVTKAALPNWVTLGSVAGDGTASVGTDGKLTFSVVAPNDGQPHILTLKLIYKYSIAWLDWLFKPSSGTIEKLLA